MKNRGFTLIELLGVIVILILIMLIVFPKIINSIKPSSKKVDDTTLELIYKATELYLDEHEDEYPKIQDFNYCISLNELIEEDYLKEPINLYENDSDITNSKSVLSTYQDGYTFELKNNNECEPSYICEAVTEKTIGNIPTGNYEIGDEYKCHATNSQDYNFLVIEENLKSVNLIMSKNFDDSAVYAVERETKLSELTENWRITARLPRIREMFKLTGHSRKNIEYLLEESEKTNPVTSINLAIEENVWIYGNLGSEEAYWIQELTAIDGWCVYNRNENGKGTLEANIDVWPYIPDCSIRPVINVPKNLIKN